MKCKNDTSILKKSKTDVETNVKTNVKDVKKQKQQKKKKKKKKKKRRKKKKRKKKKNMEGPFNGVFTPEQDNDKTPTRQMLNLCIPMMPFTPGLADLV